MDMMSAPGVVTEPYRAALEGDWEAMKRFYEGNREVEACPLTVTNDTPFHIAVYSRTKSPVQELLQILPNPPFDRPDDYRNIPLHEAGAIGNVEAARVLLARGSQLAQLEARNVLGETPMFRAAAFGMTEMVMFLASQVRRLHGDMQIQRIRDDMTSILHSAIHGQHFETALWLLRNDDILGDLKDKNGRTCLHLLANMPSAFKSGCPMPKFNSFIYFCMPNNEYDDQAHMCLSQSKDLESGGANHIHQSCYSGLCKALMLYTYIVPNRVTPNYSNQKDVLWLVDVPRSSNEHGYREIVNGIIQVYPQAVEHVSDKGLNIMHVAIRHRQKDIFDRVKQMRIPMARLVRKIDDNGYTLLHHVADMRYYSGGTQPNPALELQDELKWFERVRKIIPSHYAMNHNINDETAQDFFVRSHEYLLKEAQNWLKRTSESCSVIAVLIATVGFTAAYTVPGGSNQTTGLPILLHNPFFVVFSFMDVISLVSSLTSVVMFISILTSPFRLQDFRKSLPRKLTLAFTFLFLAVAASMLAFSATMILIIHMKERWTATLVYAVAFVPVSVFAMLQFPLYVAFMGTLKYSLSVMRKALPRNFVRKLIGISAKNHSHLF
ncbi:hypothetical protein FNV43_RR07874 [Rhamnella rubrinervis]|uniref:PGG domain-containing protein n=1 Tax=Rhamnella rubrinervis TaxID=2594499 RepID=A0A8K0MN47_9ROSA|nr:hypothetical protein FNV43_RR07874 [Rhamnella rubrinervis]